MKRVLVLGAALAMAVSTAFGAPAGNFSEAAAAINQTIRANHFRRADLDRDSYRQIEQEVIALGEKATSPDEFIQEFNVIWRKGPFSHVGLRKADELAATRTAKLDTLIVGPEGVTLEWRGSTAILSVTTMNGVDTIEAINAAYGNIVARKADRLIIDLRRNVGGAFAVVPLVGHLIEKPVDVGVFAVAAWFDGHRDRPTAADFATATPWLGYSVAAFQVDVVTRPLTSYRIEPAQPLFNGAVFVLTSKRTMSAAEIAGDALQSIGRAKVVGEKTPGAVLSSKLFDIPGGFHLRVPIADYYSIRSGRLEGVGVTPDIAVSADEALDVALNAP